LPKTLSWPICVSVTLHTEEEECYSDRHIIEIILMNINKKSMSWWET